MNDGPLLRLTRRLGRYSERAWFLPLNGLLAGADLFIAIVPVDALLVSAVLLRPRRWIAAAVWVALGSAIGSAALGAIASAYGPPFVEWIAGGFFHSAAWTRTESLIANYGIWALLVGAVGPIPVMPFALVGGLAHQPWTEIFGAVFAGRLIKYLVYAWIATRAPKLLTKLRGASKGL